MFISRDKVEQIDRRLTYGEKESAQGMRDLRDAIDQKDREIKVLRDTLRKEINMVHDLVNNLATQLGYKRNGHTKDSICPDRWIAEDTDLTQDIKAVIEPTGRVREDFDR